MARTVDAVWRIESAHIVGTLARLTGDIGLAEDLAQEAVLDALAQWPVSGIPQNPAAWLTAVAKRTAIDGWRRRERRDARYEAIARDLGAGVGAAVGVPALWEPIDDDVLRLIFTACHPVLGREAQIALTLRIIGGLTTEEIARLFLVPVATVQARITRAKKTLQAARVPFEVPEPNEWAARLGSVLGVVYLIFTEGYAATSGDHWMRPDLANEALRVGRVLAGLVPREPEVHALVALMELQASRFGARVTSDGTPILLADQDRSRWDRAQIARGVAALARADALAAGSAPAPVAADSLAAGSAGALAAGSAGAEGLAARSAPGSGRAHAATPPRRPRGRGCYALQAAIAEVHATAPTFAQTDWAQIVLLYEALGTLAPSPIVELNRAVAVSMATGPASALLIVDRLAASGALAGSHLLPSVRGELLARLGRTPETRAALAEAAARTANARERATLLARAAAL